MHRHQLPLTLPRHLLHVCACVSVGNGPDRTQILLDFFHGHGMVARSTYDHVNSLCGDWIDPPTECLRAAQQATRSVGSIDVYNVYDVCGNDNLDYHPAPPTASPILRAPDTAVDSLADPVVCVPTVLSEDYLSNEAVRKAIHVVGNRTQWTECYNIAYNRSIPSLLDGVYPRLIANMNVLIYSGDADACVPWNGSYNWTRHLAHTTHTTETQSWRPWYVNADGRQWTAGFATRWGANFTYVTIKHAGHMVPAFEPEAAIAFYTAFLKHQLPNDEDFLGNSHAETVVVS